MLFKLLKIIEQRAAIAQGKGYGTSTVKKEVNFINSLLKAPPRLAIDIGGNVGDYAHELRNINRTLEVHIFEPSHTNTEKLVRRFAGDSFTKIVPKAVSNITGSAVLYANVPGSGLGSMTKRNLQHFDIEFEHSEVIDTIRFDDYWKSTLESRELDIVKMDVEGHELHVLEGFGDAVRATKVIQFEFGGCNIDTRTYFQDFWYFFKQYAFEIFRIGPFGLERIDQYREIDEHFLTTNYIARNTK
jgi:FkbM family methyltransferase